MDRALKEGGGRRCGFGGGVGGSGGGGVVVGVDGDAGCWVRRGFGPGDVGEVFGEVPD